MLEPDYLVFEFRVECHSHFAEPSLHVLQCCNSWSYFYFILLFLHTCQILSCVSSFLDAYMGVHYVDFSYSWTLNLLTQTHTTIPIWKYPWGQHCVSELFLIGCMACSIICAEKLAVSSWVWLLGSQWYFSVGNFVYFPTWCICQWSWVPIYMMMFSEYVFAVGHKAPF